MSIQPEEETLFFFFLPAQRVAHGLRPPVALSSFCHRPFLEHPPDSDFPFLFFSTAR